MRKQDIESHISDNKIDGEEKGIFTLQWDVYFDGDGTEEEAPSLLDMEVKEDFFNTIIKLIDIDSKLFDENVVDIIREECEEFIDQVEGLELEDSSIDYLFKRGLIEFKNGDDYLMRLRFTFETSYNKVIDNFDDIINTSGATLVI